jgi:TPR repeat protein
LTYKFPGNYTVWDIKKMIKAGRYKMKVLLLIGITLQLYLSSIVSVAQAYPEGVKAYLAQEFSESYPLLLKEAEAGNIDSAFYLGLSYNEGSGTNINNVKAARWLKVAADAGHLIAPFEYGTLLKYGNGVKRDQGVAKIWFDRGMERIDQVKELAWSGDGIAQVTLSVLFSGGFEQNMESAEKALFWSQRAYEQGFPQGVLHYAVDLFFKDEANLEEAYRILLPHAKSGYIWSMYLAYKLCHNYSDKPIQGCEEETKDFLQIASDKGYTEAKIDLVWQKVKKVWDDKEQINELINELEAIDLLQDSGGEAAYKMGIIFLRNRAVADNKKAFDMMSMAHKKGYKRSALYLGEMYNNGWGVEVDKEKGFEFYIEAAEKKLSGAEHKVGQAYEIGQGIEKDTVKSKEWYLKALDSGDEEAESALMSLRWTWPTDKYLSYLFFMPGDGLVYFANNVFEEWEITHEDYGTTLSAFLSLVIWIVGFIAITMVNDQ